MRGARLLLLRTALAAHALGCACAIRPGAATVAGARPQLGGATAPPPAVGLPRECNNYEQRYRHEYFSGLQHSAVANARHPDSEFLVVLAAHAMQREGQLPLDLLVSMRALASEVTNAGYHFLISLQVPRPTFFQAPQLRGLPPTFNRHQALALLPPDLAPFLDLHDFDEDFAAYPKLGEGDDPTIDPSILWGPGPRASYLAVARIMQRFQHYKWVWNIEQDVRWTGPDWGHLLNAALSLAIQATPEELAADPFRRARQDRLASRVLPTADQALPDLLTFGYIFESPKWARCNHNVSNGTQPFETAGIVYGGSRRFWDEVHALSLAGTGSHLEGFIATVAMNAPGMKAAAIDPERHPVLPNSWHCCRPDGGIGYSDFHNRTACSTSLLLHPIKNDEPFWPRVHGPAFAAARALPAAVT